MRTLSGHLQGLSLLLASMAVSCNAESAQPTYMQDGPCGALPVAHYIVPLNHSEALTGSRVAGKKLRVTVTAPAHVASLESGIIREPPWPVIFFLNGFLLPYFDALRSWLANQSELQKVVDLNRIGVAGHSRGAKLAALLFSSRAESIQAAFLVDPVDNTRETPESDNYPSAAKALKAHNRPVGMCGASVIGSCNPDGSNWRHFWSAVAKDSWLLTVRGASHNTFLHASWLVDKILDVLCKRGTTSHQDTIALTVPVMVGWMDKELHQGDQHDVLQRDLLAWIRSQVQTGHVDFEQKDNNGGQSYS